MKLPQQWQCGGDGLLNPLRTHILDWVELHVAGTNYKIAVCHLVIMNNAFIRKIREALLLSGFWWRCQFPLNLPHHTKKTHNFPEALKLFIETFGNEKLTFAGQIILLNARD